MKLDRHPIGDLAQTDSNAAFTRARADERGRSAGDRVDEPLDLRLRVTTNGAEVKNGPRGLAWLLHVRLTTSVKLQSTPLRQTTSNGPPTLRTSLPPPRAGRDSRAGPRSHGETETSHADAHRIFLGCSVSYRTRAILPSTPARAASATTMMAPAKKQIVAARANEDNMETSSPARGYAPSTLMSQAARRTAGGIRKAP
jgi:hypothetical protein